MKERVIKLWTNALRSKKYNQVPKNEVLRNNKDEYCVLGVLCDLHSKENNISWDLDKDKGYYTYLGMSSADDFRVEKIEHWSGEHKINQNGFSDKWDKISDCGSLEENADLIEDCFESDYD